MGACRGTGGRGATGAGPSAPERELSARERIEAEHEAMYERWADGIPADIQAQIDAERGQIEAFLKKKIPERGWFGEDIGDQSFERETLARAKKDLKDAMSDGVLSDDDVWDIQYTDGTVERVNWVLQEGRKVRMTGIRAIINSNESTTMFAGPVRIYSFLEETAQEFYEILRQRRAQGRRGAPIREPEAGYGNDWRVDFNYTPRK